MKVRHLCFPVVALAWLLAPAPALANGSCTITSVALSAQTYNNGLLTATGTVNYTCTRTSNAVDGNRITFNVTADPGLNYSGGTRQAANGSNDISYSLRVGAANWGDGTAGLGNGHSVTVNYTGGQTTKSSSFNFTLRVPASQNPQTAPTPYLDTFVVDGTCTTAKGTPCAVTGNTGQVSILAPTSCTLGTPANFTLSYTAFQASPAMNNTSFAVNCGNGGPYRMSVSPTGATVLGITYTLKLGTAPNSATDVSSTTTYNRTGTGSPDTYYVNASAVPGQSGICSGAVCSQLGPSHTLLLEY
jgi:hypothetical protein